MFADTALSCCLLLLASGSSVYLTVKDITDNFSTISALEPKFLFASVGVLGINVRSVFNLLSPFFLHASYPIDPLEVEEEDEDKANLRVVPYHEKFCRVLSNSGFIYAICESYGNRKTGTIIVFTIILLEIYHACQENYPKHQWNNFFHFIWLFAGGLIGRIKRNYYFLLAYLPYGISFLAFTPEKECAWSVQRIINNYMMIAHVFLMVQAIHEE